MNQTIAEKIFGCHIKKQVNAGDILFTPIDLRCHGCFACCCGYEASYAGKYSFDISSLEPQVAFPHQVDNVHPISEVKKTKIAMAFLGTCTNGRLEDLAVAAQILKGKKVYPGVVLVVAPASREVMLEACDRGYINLVASIFTRLCDLQIS